MSKKRDQIIGIRLTKDEKEEIVQYIKNHDLSITEFIRKALASYNNNIEEETKKQHLKNINFYSEKLKTALTKFNQDFNEITLTLNDLSNNFNQLNRELYLFMFKRTD